MIKAILVPTVRFDYFIKFLDSLKHLPTDWVIYSQIALFTREQGMQIAHHPQSDRLAGIIWENKRMPPWIARTNILKKYRADIWCNADDDIEWTEHTHVEPILEKLQEPACGLITGNWARTESLLPKKVAAMQHKFVKQPIVFTAGGMFLRDEHVQILLRDEATPWFVDDVHMALTLYLNGFTNYRYLGSLAIHRIQTKGGLIKIYQTDNTLVHPDPRYLMLHPCAPMYKEAPRNNFLMPMSKDLTEAAHELHNQNKETKDAQK